MSKKKGFFATHKAKRARAKRKEQWTQASTNIQTVSAGVGIVATVIGGVVALVNLFANDTTDREITRTDQMVALSMDAQKAGKGAYSRSHRRQARNTRKAAERALESLAARRITAEADYA